MMDYIVETTRCVWNIVLTSGYVILIFEGGVEKAIEILVVDL